MSENCVAGINTRSRFLRVKLERRLREFVGMKNNLENYISCQKGSFPVLITCPHDGIMEPEEIKHRKKGVTIRDLHTTLVAQSLVDQFPADMKPYYVALNISRKSVDVNRDEDHCIDHEVLRKSSLASNKKALAIHKLYHSKIEEYIDDILLSFPFVFLLDVHGQGHRKNCIELGILLSNQQLRNLPPFEENPISAASQEYEKMLIYQSSFQNISHFSLLNEEHKENSLPLTKIIFGAHSFGSLLAARGFNCIPRVDKTHGCSCSKKECNCKFFKGGWTTQKYCLQKKKPVFGVQMEIPTDMRVGPTKSDKYHPNHERVADLAESIHDATIQFLSMHLTKL